MDVDIKIDKYRFLLRCSAIITDKERKKVILFKVKGRDFYMLPGGRINFQESSYDAIKREMKEELNLDNKYKLICIEENFLENKNIQNIEFIYLTEVNNIENITPQENKNQVFDIIDIIDIDNIKLKPSNLKELIKTKEINNIIHKINHEN